MALRRKDTEVSMWFSRLIRRRVLVTSYVHTSRSKFFRHEQINQKTHETLNKLAGRPPEDIQALISSACNDSPSRIMRGSEKYTRKSPRTGNETKKTENAALLTKVTTMYPFLRIVFLTE
jgi:hypothetical protein